MPSLLQYVNMPVTTFRKATTVILFFNDNSEPKENLKTTDKADLHFSIKS